MSNNMMTPEFRVSFPYVFRPNKPMNDGDTPKYSVTMLFPAGEKLIELKKQVNALLVEKFGPKEKWPKNLRLPFRDQAEKVRKDDKGAVVTDDKGEPVLQDGCTAGALFITATSKNRPGLVDESVNDVIDEANFYAGCYARATVRPFYYKKRGNEGVAFGLQNIQKLRDGDPLGGRMRPQDEFVPVAAAADSEDDIPF